MSKFEKYAKVFISTEVPLKGALKKYQLPSKIENIHHVLYYASLVVSDTQTMTTESACLGTPAIRSNEWIGPHDASNFVELENRYGLIYNIRNPNIAIEKAIELIKKDDLKTEWKKKRKRLLNEKIDLTSFLTWFIENYPESHEIMKKNPDYQERFK